MGFKLFIVAKTPGHIFPGLLISLLDILLRQVVSHTSLGRTRPNTGRSNDKLLEDGALTALAYYQTFFQYSSTVRKAKASKKIRHKVSQQLSLTRGRCHPRSPLSDHPSHHVLKERLPLPNGRQSSPRDSS
jgi:hypothetical protein